MFAFKELFSWWKEDILMKQAFENVKLSLEKVANMFAYAVKTALEGTPDEEKIHNMDQEINALEIDTRRKVLEHLSIRPAQDITSSLILVTIIVDIERIGDYSKNIGELACLTPKEVQPQDIKDTRYLTEIRDIETKLEDGFVKVGDAFMHGDSEKARLTAIECTEINHRCDNSVNLLAESVGLMAKEIVFYTLFLRYLKRVSSHLRNISTSVLNPFDRIGYKPQST